MNSDNDRRGIFQIVFNNYPGLVSCKLICLIYKFIIVKIKKIFNRTNIECNKL